MRWGLRMEEMEKANWNEHSSLCAFWLLAQYNRMPHAPAAMPFMSQTASQNKPSLLWVDFVRNSVPTCKVIDTCVYHLQYHYSTVGSVRNPPFLILSFPVPNSAISIRAIHSVMTNSQLACTCVRAYTQTCTLWNLKISGVSIVIILAASWVYILTIVCCNIIKSLPLVHLWSPPSNTSQVPMPLLSFKLMESFSLIVVCGTYMSGVTHLVWCPLGKAPRETDSYLARTGRPRDSIEICKICAAHRLFSLSLYCCFFGYFLILFCQTHIEKN